MITLDGVTFNSRVPVRLHELIHELKVIAKFQLHRLQCLKPSFRLRSRQTLFAQLSNQLLLPYQPQFDFS